MTCNFLHITLNDGSRYQCEYPPNTTHSLANVLDVIANYFEVIILAEDANYGSAGSVRRSFVDRWDQLGLAEVLIQGPEGLLERLTRDSAVTAG
ncbi:hypothetical protein [Chromobacterium piscinae]|uniref:hypothetical protein n=1 Tax=Chromobacterium piscinae TaxID=686831 RepID=UPI00320AE7BB